LVKETSPFYELKIRIKRLRKAPEYQSKSYNYMGIENESHQTLSLVSSSFTVYNRIALSSKKEILVL